MDAMKTNCGVKKYVCFVSVVPEMMSYLGNHVGSAALLFGVWYLLVLYLGENVEKTHAYPSVMKK